LRGSVMWEFSSNKWRYRWKNCANSSSANYTTTMYGASDGRDMTSSGEIYSWESAGWRE
jgi:hypothetical protein